MYQKYPNKVAKEMVYDVIDGNGGKQVLDLIVTHALETFEKFDLNKEEKERVFRSYLEQLECLLDH